MREYKCQRCGETNYHGLSGGMCSPCLGELQSLERGDSVEWYHHSGSWRSASFVKFNHRGSTAEVKTPTGCTIYRRQANIRVPGGRIRLPFECE
jgi:hypothetical protein